MTVQKPATGKSEAGKKLALGTLSKRLARYIDFYP
jgi:hypothetical protein